MTSKTKLPHLPGFTFIPWTLFKYTLSFAFPPAFPLAFALALCFSTTLLLARPAYAEKSRQKVIDFEGDVVEGVNKRPLDSLTQISEKEKRRRKIHLYHKRRSFRTETQETLREMRYAE